MHKSERTYVFSTVKTRNGFNNTGISVFVSWYPCSAVSIVRLYYAMCYNDRQIYGRVGTAKGLCGNDGVQFEQPFYALVQDVERETVQGMLTYVSNIFSVLFNISKLFSHIIHFQKQSVQIWTKSIMVIRSPPIMEPG